MSIWLDEIPDTECFPSREGFYTALLLQMGQPDIKWMLDREKLRKIYEALEQHGYDYQSRWATRSALLQFIHWYEQQSLTRK